MCSLLALNFEVRVKTLNGTLHCFSSLTSTDRDKAEDVPPSNVFPSTLSYTNSITAETARAQVTGVTG